MSDKTQSCIAHKFCRQLVLALLTNKFIYFVTYIFYVYYILMNFIVCVKEWYLNPICKDKFHWMASIKKNVWQRHSEKIFKLQKRVIRFITHSRMRDLCRELFKRLEISPLYSQYIFSLSMFILKNKHLFTTNSQIHSVHTWFKTNLHSPIANFTKFQKGVYYSRIKIFNNIPH
jgi:hypothetical protein